ncbi:hypothetical protein [Acinetobacter sp. NCu2D-2]|uniref:hypothetical protein n=1 Tax=Acinetobacter sp. NCu2D-2 TaxID=1608473 RepID=UPI000A434152|nr:hypothetical protein [Acinetobacter sp. NCu2D-2]
MNESQPLSTQDIRQGLVVLKKRQRSLKLWTGVGTSFVLATLAGLYLQHDLIYSFFGLSNEVQQLHIPVSVQDNLLMWGNDPDYFWSLLSWFGWLIVKIFSAFFCAFIVVSALKKFRYFAIRFQSFVLKFVGWLIAFILIWSGLSYWQHDLQDEQKQMTETLVYYDQNIHQSTIAQSLTEQNTAQPIEAYLLAQTALLHRPADLASAKPYVKVLIDAENKDANFERYGFKSEQLWSMQQQVFQDAVTPAAKSVLPKIEKADQLNGVVQTILIVFLLISAVFSLVMFVLSRNIQNRTQRIEQQISVKFFEKR